MILVSSGIVLSRRPHREFDRLTQVYTPDLGRIAVRFSGVERPRGKLKALSEPMTHADFRLYKRSGSPWFTATGGQLIDTFPRVRTDLAFTLQGLEICELLLRLTPEDSPNPLKFNLVETHLQALESVPSPWLSISFGLKLLRLAGLGPDPVPVAPGDLPLWACLLDTPAGRLRSVGAAPGQVPRLRAVLERLVEQYVEAPLRTRAFRESMAEGSLASA